jgi:8-oxo-dGTP pyrophosphatase MutT (NUDIX family)
MNETEFLEHLRSEKLKAQEARTNYTLRKLVYVTALLGIGALEIKQFDLSALLYLAPFVALAFDLYVLGEDYSVKRIGTFLGAQGSGALEQQWEQWVSQNRDPFAPVAMPILTTLAFLGAAIVIWVGGRASGLLFWVWLALAWLPGWVLFATYRRRKQRLDIARPIIEGHPDLSKPLRRLGFAVEKAEYTLNRKTFDQTRRLFTACTSKPEILENLRKLAPEYGKPEFLLCVDSQGAPMHLPQDAIEDFRETVKRSPDFEAWFQEPELETVAGEKRPVLLIARWLCHLVGFRHRTVHLFIDHPTRDDYTLVQVRGTDKFESPGRFDLPAAGHVVGSEPPREAVFKELEEELNWEQDDIEGLEPVGSYNYCEPVSNSVLRNVEFRLVFTSRLKSDRLLKLKFVDREVAAISIFKLSELEAIISDFPERVASGLGKSFPMYSRSKSQ